MATKGQVPAQFLPNYKKGAAAPAKPPAVKPPGKAGGDAVTPGDVTLLKNILAENNIPAPKAQKIVKAFKAGNS